MGHDPQHHNKLKATPGFAAASVEQSLSEDMRSVNLLHDQVIATGQQTKHNAGKLLRVHDREAAEGQNKDFDTSARKLSVRR